MEVTKLVAQKWYQLSNEEKQPYLELAKLDKERFKRELKEFNKNQQPEDVPHSPSKKKSKGGSKSKSEQTNIQSSTTPAISDPVVDETPKAFIGPNCELPVYFVINGPCCRMKVNLIQF